MSDNMNNLEKLTDQIYQEGIEKAEKQSKKILEDAEAEKSRILKEANAEAQVIKEKAEREAKQLEQSVNSELELRSKQFISDLKAKIKDLLAESIIDDKTKEALADVDFLQSVIREVLNNWENKDHLELILPKNLEEKIEGAMTNSIKEVAPNMMIRFEDELNHGFRIAKKDDNYKISFSDDDFMAIFRSYLSRQTDKVLFKSN